jgi:hypothetical protein
MGKSFYEISFWDLHGTLVMTHFMQTLGYPYHAATQEQVTEARKISGDMGEWPDKSSVQVKNNLIIIKLS